MATSLRSRVLAWLIRRHPTTYLRLKGLGVHRLGEARRFLALHADLVAHNEGLLTLRERYNLWMLAGRVAARPGAIAEFGVYRGASARVLAAAKGASPLYLFDTFSGLPASDPSRDGAFVQGEFADTRIEAVRASLAGWPEIYFCPGLFPESAAALPPGLRFKLVHLDADLYSSTLEGLRFFYPRTLVGGVILLHDYNDRTVPGVRAALDEFLGDKPEVLIEIWDTQALIVKQ